MIKDYEKGLSCVEIGKKYNCDRKTVSRLLKKNNITLRKSYKIGESEYPNIISKYKSGSTSYEIADLYNVSYPTILKILKDNDTEVKSRKYHVLPICILDEYDSGIRSHILAKKYNCDHKTILSFLRSHNHKLAPRKNIEQYLESIKTLYKNGLSAKKIAIKYNCHMSRILKILTENNIPRDNQYICFESQAELNWNEYIQDLGYKTIQRHKIGDKRMEIDIYLPEQKVGFEYNGTFWHSKKTPSYHNKKTQYALENGIKLYHIWEGDDIDIIKNKISSVLKHDIVIIPARECKVIIPNRKQAKDFFTAYHLHGFSGSKYYALKDNISQELVSMMSFHGNELSRFACQFNVSVTGGFKKLLSVFIKEYRPKELISFSYRDWSPIPENTIYAKSGWKHDRYSGASMWYTKGGIRFNRRSFQKQNLKNKFPETFNPKLTERENMELQGFDQVFDSGSDKFILKF